MKRPRDRQAQIAELIRRQSAVTVEELAERFRASHETIRRDLGALADAGIVRKVHGGAKLPRARTGEGPFDQRMTENAAAKRVIALKAAALVEPGQTVFIDTGSTTLMCAEALAKIGGLTVITNSTRIAEVFGAEGPSTVFLLGGRFESDNRETVGPIAIAGIAAFQADLAILTVGAIDRSAGLMDYSFDEAQVARAMIANAASVMVLADGSKFDRRAPFKVGALDAADLLVTEHDPDAQWTTALKAANVTIR